VRRIFAVRRGGGGVVGAGSCVGHDFRLLRSGICRFSALGGLKKDIHFMTGELGAERRCQLPKPEGARKRARRLLCRAELHKRS
jgi:hypothetical protein